MSVDEPAKIDNCRILKTHSNVPPDTIKEIADMELDSCVIKHGARTGVTCEILKGGCWRLQSKPPTPVSLQ